MESTNSHQQSASALLFNQYKACILLPTYNNHQTILEVIRKSLLQTNHVIVINDGSTDNTLAIIKDEPVQIVSYDKIKERDMRLGKGLNMP